MLISFLLSWYQNCTKQDQFCPENTICEDAEKISLQIKPLKRLHVLRKKLYMKTVYHNISITGYEILLTQA